MNRKIAIMIILFIVLLGLGIAGWFYYVYVLKINNRETSLVAFISKGTSIIYRTYLGKYFDGENVKVKLYIKDLKSNEFKVFDNNFTGFGKITEGEIVKRIVNKEFDGGVISGGALILAISKKLPIVAVASLGYGQGFSRSIILRKDIKISSPDEMKGTAFLSQEGSDDEVIYLKEFFESRGIDPSADVKIIDQVDRKKSLELLKEKKVDGGIYRSSDVETILKENMGYVYRQMDWMDPRLNFSVLVFHKDFVKNYKDKVKKIVLAYGKRVQYEKDRPEDQRNLSESGGKFVINGWTETGASLGYDYPPIVNIERAYQLQDLEMKYGIIRQKEKIEDYIDNSFAKALAN